MGPYTYGLLGLPFDLVARVSGGTYDGFWLTNYRTIYDWVCLLYTVVGDTYSTTTATRPTLGTPFPFGFNVNAP